MTTTSTTTRRGRPFRYDIDTKRAIVATYTETPKGQRLYLAEQLGISFNTFLVYICKWRKELREIDDLCSISEELKEGKVANVG